MFQNDSKWSQILWTKIVIILKLVFWSPTINLPFILVSLIIIMQIRGFTFFEASIITHLRILLIYYIQAEHLLLKCCCLYFVFNMNCLFVYRIIPKLVLCYQFTFVTNIILLFVALWPKKCFQHILDWKSLLVITLFDTFNWSQFCIC